MSSVASLVSKLTPEQLSALIRQSGWRSRDEFAREALYRWRGFHARPEQVAPPGDWKIWLVCAGRGWGKTRTGAEWVREQVAAGKRRLHVVCPTAADCRDVATEGESGILSIFPPDERPEYESSKRRITFKNGATVTLFSADEPERLRGPQCDAAWCDELAAWRRCQEAWDMLQFGLRLGDDPRCVVTTTPKPTPLVKELVARKDDDVVITTGSTYDNAANLAPSFLKSIRDRYEGTTLGRQELYAEILGDVEGALWHREMLEESRVLEPPTGKRLGRVVVGVDPSVGDPKNGKIDECGIVVACTDFERKGYVIDDRSLRASPDKWAREVVAAYHTHKADRVVAESNQGGEMVRLTIRTVDPNVPVTLVHASRGKQARAEPVAALYEQQRIHHVGTFDKLEDEMCSWIPGTGPSPNRIDAAVWALTNLMLTGGGPLIMPATSGSASKWRV